MQFILRKDNMSMLFSTKEKSEKEVYRLRFLHTFGVPHVHSNYEELHLKCKKLINVINLTGHFM